MSDKLRSLAELAKFDITLWDKLQMGQANSGDQLNISYLNQPLSKIDHAAPESQEEKAYLFELADFFAPIFALPKGEELFQWVYQASLLAPDLCDWIGLYFRASLFMNENTDDLVLGPYIGASTPHKRIPVERGLCGLAVREERVVNVADVKSRPDYLACSIQTRSEIVIPLRNSVGQIIGELDIDSHSPAAFDQKLEQELMAYCEHFQSPFP